MEYQAPRHHVPLLNEADEDQDCCHIVEDPNFDWDCIPEPMRRMEPPPIPSLSEPSVVRHFTLLSRMNFGVDVGMYPLGSCTMKYNPKVSELLAAHPGISPLCSPATGPASLAQPSSGLGTQNWCRLAGYPPAPSAVA